MVSMLDEKEHLFRFNAGRSLHFKLLQVEDFVFAFKTFDVESPTLFACKGL